MRAVIFVLVVLLFSFFSFCLDISQDLEITGACNDTQDLTIFKNDYSTFHGLLLNCSQSCLGTLNCTQKCCETSIGLTTGCSLCFAEDVGCTAQHCISICFANPNSPKCVACSEQYCFPALVTCAGVDASVIPP